MANNGQLAQVSTSTLFYYLHDAHGDVSQPVNEKAEVIKDYRYDPYGQEETAEIAVFGGRQTQAIWRQEVEKIDNRSGIVVSIWMRRQGIIACGRGIMTRHEEICYCKQV